MNDVPGHGDRISRVRISSCYLPLANPISDAKVLTGRQKPMTEIAMLFAEIETKDGHQGLGFSYAKRAGGPGQFAHAKEVAPALVGEDPATSRGCGPSCAGPVRRWAAAAWRCRPSGLSTWRCMT